MEFVPEISGAEDCPLGFSAAEQSAFAEVHHLAEIADHFPYRGDAERLGTIAWWGSALGEIASVKQPADYSRILWESGAFNLAVALFDSVVEKAAGQIPLLAQALEPRRMKARLNQPLATSTALICREPKLNLIVQLFDVVLSAAGCRLSLQPARLDHLSEMLDVMYRSELGLSRDRFAAKTKPVIFIGALANTPETTDAYGLFEALAIFIQFWDDWLDLAEDLPKLAPNVFLGGSQPVTLLRAVAYSSRGLARILGGELFHESVARTLGGALHDVLEMARAWDEQAYRKTVSLCCKLIR